MILNAGEDIFIVVESELDGFLIAQEAGDMVFVVALGSAQIRPHQELVEKLGCSRLILVALDADSAGGKEAWDWWSNEFSQSYRWPPVDGKDPGEMLLAGVGLRDWVEVGVEEAMRQTSPGDELPQEDFPEPDPGSVENLEALQEVLGLAFAGKLTKTVRLPVSPRFQAVLGTDFVWLCPNRMDAEKMPGLAFAAHELSTIVPMVHENPELFAKLIMAKDVLGGTIVTDDDKKECG
jgi:hypothetical protein